MNDKSLLDTIKYFSLLFSHNDYVWCTNRINQKHYSIEQERAITWLFNKSSDEGSFIAINGTEMNGTNKSNEHVTTFRNIVLEFDKLPLDEQIPFMKQKGIPYTTCVFSGGKSYHFVISLEKPLNSLMEYKDFFYRLHHLCENKNDKACSDPSRFSRFPNGSRNGVRQTLLYLGERIPKSAFDSLIYTPEFEASYKKTKWYYQYMDISEYYQNFTANADRTDIIQKLSWYVEYGSDKKWVPNRRIFVQCPVCSEEGRDNHADNMCISGHDALFCCFADEDHNKEILPAINRLMIDAGVITDKSFKIVEPSGNLIDWGFIDYV